MKTWRLLDTGVLSAAENMALDEVILEARSKNFVPNTLRLLQFNPPAVLVGYYQSVEQEVRMDFCRKHRIDINRRITGGGAIFFDNSQLGWGIYASKKELGITNLEILFKRICQAVIFGLKRLGIEAKYRPKNDIEVAGRKISGTGGTEEKGAFLFQGTLLMDFDVDTMLKSLRIPTEKLMDKGIESARERTTCLQWELGYLPKLSEVKDAIREGFEETLKIKLKEEGISEYEEALFNKKIDRFKSKGWIYKTNGAPDELPILNSIYRTKGGSIQVSLAINVETNIIQSILLTGDFFSHPRRAVFDLEAALKFTPAEIDRIQKVVFDFFKEKNGLFPDISPSDFVSAIYEAVKKVECLKFGISFPEANQIFTVNGTFGEIIKKRPSFLLLPYCAKLVDCGLRYKKECEDCGQCGVGDVYRLAHEKGLRPVTITSFENLMETLTDLESQQIRSYIGSCCRQFYVKHRKDFESARLSGILIDVESTTCYELGEEKKAYAGHFEGQTQLNMALIKRVLEAREIN
ncbi:Biotin/lipoate A/B protein ligase [uncultured Desulfobacterium sp.]|uniref:Biotin/lipoate A/B protein ligase n=1 Tax=uncultured Desulfobacterium sp. TaxID=201089 RepID=A0A445MYZ6_9BACT|nr:Biotin/lipoate A/B protein ligase [uncultured Desulfobacterium sp.]